MDDSPNFPPNFGRYMVVIIIVAIGLSYSYVATFVTLVVITYRKIFRGFLAGYKEITWQDSQL